MSIQRIKAKDVLNIVIHCSASLPLAKLGAADIDRWHRERGFAKIGYHYVIRTNGDLEVGREIDFINGTAEMGAHAAGFNRTSIGICLIGGVDRSGKSVNNFTDDQFATLGELLLTSLLVRFPNATVVGHRDLPGVAKDCPCFDVTEWCRSTGIAGLSEET